MTRRSSIFRMRIKRESPGSGGPICKVEENVSKSQTTLVTLEFPILTRTRCAFRKFQGHFAVCFPASRCSSVVTGDNHGMCGLSRSSPPSSLYPPSWFSVSFLFGVFHGRRRGHNHGIHRIHRKHGRSNTRNSRNIRNEAGRSFANRRLNELSMISKRFLFRVFSLFG